MATATGVYVRIDKLKDLLPEEDYIKQAAVLTEEDPQEM